MPCSSQVSALQRNPPRQLSLRGKLQPSTAQVFTGSRLGAALPFESPDSVAFATVDQAKLLGEPEASLASSLERRVRNACGPFCPFLLDSTCALLRASSRTESQQNSDSVHPDDGLCSDMGTVAVGKDLLCCRTALRTVTRRP